MLPNLAQISGSAMGTVAHDEERGREAFGSPILHVRRPHSLGPILISVSPECDIHEGQPIALRVSGHRLIDMAGNLVRL